MYLVSQISRDLKGLQWLRYDREYREWAAAKGVCVWGTLNLSVYGRCLAMPVLPPQQPALPSPSQKGSSRSKSTPRKSKACFKYNFEASCGRTEQKCFFDHTCWYCSAKDHVGPECPVAPKRPKSGKKAS